MENNPGRSRRLVVLALVACLLFAMQSVWANPAPSSSGSSAGARPATAPPATKSRAAQYYEQGMRFISTKEYAKAAAQFEYAVAEKKDYAEAHNMLGYSYRHAGDYARALESYRVALRLKPDFAEAHEYIGEAYLGLGDLLHAMQHYLVLQKMRSPEARELWAKIVAHVESKAQG